MCKAFSCLVTKSNKVYWKIGVDSHDELHDMYKKKDVELADDKDAPHNTFARIEIVPKNGDYLKPDKWVYQIDERVKPGWIKKIHKDTALKAHEEWKSQLYSKIALDQFPEHPFKIKSPEIQKKHLKLLKEWDSVGTSVGTSVGASVRASVWDSVWDSVRASVGASVWASVGDSVGTSVGASVGDSVGTSVWAQIGPIFPGIKKWKYTDKIKDIKGYPFKSAVKLWRMGLVPCKDYSDKWYLIGSPKGDGKVEILWSGTKEEL